MPLVRPHLYSVWLVTYPQPCVDTLCKVVALACRWAWVHSEDPNDKAYPEKRAHFYDLFEKLLTSNNASGAHVVGGKPSTADAIVFGQLFDDIVLHDNAPIQTYPKLKALYEAFIAQPKVLQWCKSRSLKAVL